MTYDRLTDPLDDRPLENLPAREVWGLVEQQRFCHEWLQQQPLRIAARVPKEAGRPSFELERERGYVT